MRDGFEMAYPADGFASSPDLPESTPDPVAEILAALREDQSALADEIVRAIEAVGQDADDAARAATITHVLMAHRSALEAMLQGAHLAAALQGMHQLLDAAPGGPEAIPAAAVGAASAVTAQPNQGVTTPAAIGGSRVLPLVEEAARSLVQRGVVPAEQVDRAAQDAAGAARQMADAALRDTHAVINRALVEAVRSGGTKEEFATTVRRQLAEHGDSYLSDAAIENRFRTGVMSAYSDGQMRLVEGNPFARALFPYAAFHATHDDRVRHDHLGLETAGLDGTNVYRLDDPTFIKYRPPVFFNCRCVWAPLSVEGAAKVGVKEAQEWLRTGTPPASPQWVQPPKEPPVTFAEAGYTLASDGFEPVAADGFEMAWVADQNYKGTRGGKWIGTGDDAGKRPRYQKAMPGTRGKKQPAATGDKKPRAPRKQVPPAQILAELEPHGTDVAKLAATLAGHTYASLQGLAKHLVEKANGKTADLAARLLAKLEERAKQKQPAEKSERAEKKTPETRSLVDPNAEPMEQAQQAAAAHNRKGHPDDLKDGWPTLPLGNGAPVRLLKPEYGKPLADQRRARAILVDAGKYDTRKGSPRVGDLARALAAGMGVSLTDAYRQIIQWREDDVLTLQAQSNQHADYENASGGLMGNKGLLGYFQVN